MTLKLYEIASEVEALVSQIPETPEEETQLAEQLNALERSLEYKVEGIAKFLRNLDAEEDALKAEVDRLQARRMKVRRAREWLRNYTKNNLERLGVQKVKLPTFTVSVSKGKPSIVVERITDIPEEFTMVVVDRKVDKQKILDHVKKTGEIPEGVRVEEGSSLRIT